MKKTIISLSLVICMALGLSVHNLGMSTSMNLSLENDGTLILSPACYPGDIAPK